MSTASPNPRLALVTSRFNAKITGGLKRGALARLADAKIAVAKEDMFEVSGAYEIPLIAQRLARTGRYDGVIALGCVIKGETAHFEFISLGATIGTMQAMLATETPIAFGVITTYTREQAEARAADGPHNSGAEAASACLETLGLLRRIDSAG